MGKLFKGHETTIEKINDDILTYRGLIEKYLVVKDIGVQEKQINYISELKLLFKYIGESLLFLKNNFNLSKDESKVFEIIGIFLSDENNLNFNLKLKKLDDFLELHGDKIRYLKKK